MTPSRPWARGVARWSPAAVLVLVVLGLGVGPHGSDASQIRPHGLTLAAIGSVRVPARAAASWCGEPSQVDRAPNAVAGNPVHWVYAIPSDGQDRLSTVASVMQTDAEEIDAWWQSQDATRLPRNDLAPFSCGLQLDVTTVRLSRSSLELSPLEGRFEAVLGALNAAGLRSPFTKYVVYVDGTVSDDNVCGEGGSDPSGLGLAAVYLQACTGASTAGVAAHELLHTLGAVPRGAPNECRDENAGHTCDDPTDLMHPSIGDAPLAAKVLDPARDDYYGHAGRWTDAQDSSWLVWLDRQAPLVLSISGPGSVSGDVPGLQCARSCTSTWNTGQRLALTATSEAGAKLVRWGGACGGASDCNVTVAPGTAVSALFAPATFRLTVGLAGRGAVRSSRSGITCRPRCSASFPSYVPVRLTASAAKGWRFRAWGGACKGSRPTCTVPMTAETTARAVFVRA